MNKKMNQLHLIVAFVFVLICSPVGLLAQMDLEQLGKEREEIETHIERSIPGYLKRSEFNKAKAQLEIVEKCLAEVKEDAEKAELEENAYEWIQEYENEIDELTAAISALETGMSTCGTFHRKMTEFGNDGIDDLFNKAITASEASNAGQARVESAFNAVKSKTISKYKELKKIEEKSFAQFRKAVGWRPKARTFYTLKRTMVTLMTDSVKRNKEADSTLTDDPAYRAALEGEDANICIACIEGQIDEARKSLRTWRPIRVKLAKDISDNYKLVPRASGWIDVVVHGSADSVKLASSGKKIDADHDAIFEILNMSLKPEDLSEWQKLHKSAGVGIRLLACETGGKADGYAQKLADYTGVKVQAPTEKLNMIRIGGSVHVIIHQCGDCDDYKEQSARSMHIYNSEDRGSWKTFSPKGDADELLRDDLVELTKKEKWWRIHLTEAKLKYDWETTIEKLHSINPRLKTIDIEHLFKRDGKLVFMESVTQAEASKNLHKVKALGFKAFCEPMPRYLDEFKNVKLRD